MPIIKMSKKENIRIMILLMKGQINGYGFKRIINIEYAAYLYFFTI